jgi:predicted RNA binding protein YcfA (HicA-like mRNA interferase family)
MRMRDLLELLRRDGWYVERTRGSHRQMRHPIKKGTVTAAGAPSEDVHPKTLKSILRQAQLEKP